MIFKAKGLGWAVLLGAWALSSCELIEPFQTKGIALVYGGSNYTNVNDLLGTKNDAEVMAALLEEAGYTVYLRVDNAPILSSRVDMIPLDRKDDPASKVQLYADFAALGDLLEPDDTFVFYFAGHGGPVNSFADNPPDWANEPDEDGFSTDYDEHLVFYDIPAISGLTPTEWRDYTLSDDELAELLSSLPFSTPKMVLIDACYSGGFIGSGKEARLDPRKAIEEPLQAETDAWNAFFNYGGSQSDVLPSTALVLSAAGEREESWEASNTTSIDPDADPLLIVNENRGVFTYFLQKGIKTGAADYDGDGLITMTEAYQYTRSNIKDVWNASKPEGAQQRFLPHISGGSVDFVLVNVP